MVHLEDILLSECVRNGGSSNENTAVCDRLGHLVLSAMGGLTPFQRGILDLKYIDQMPFKKIAYVFGCGVLTARLSCFFARIALKRQLKRQGFGSSSLSLALAFFGNLTAFD